MKASLRLPAFLLEPVLDLARALLLGAGAAAADQHDAVLDDVEVAAFEGAGGHHVVDRDAELFVGADGRIVLAAPPPLRHGGDDRAIGGHDARIPGIDLHRQFRRRLVPVDLHPEVLVGSDEVLVLRLRRLDVAGRLAQMLARQGTRREMAQEGRRAEQHVGQRIGLVGKAPASQPRRAAGRVAALQREGFRGEAFVRVHGVILIRRGCWEYTSRDRAGS